MVHVRGKAGRVVPWVELSSCQVVVQAHQPRDHLHGLCCLLYNKQKKSDSKERDNPPTCLLYPSRPQGTCN